MDPLEPQPPRDVPPVPPRPEWVKPAVSAAPAPGAAPGMDYFQRRVEALERELALERERAQTAQSMISHQESLKSEVETHLKAMTDQLRREKAERDADEARSHSRGRVEALEKRLDEMNSTFAQLLKEAVSSRDAARTPRDEKLFEESVGRRLDEFSARLMRSLDEWKRAQEAARAELDARVEALTRERGDLGRTWETQARGQREEQFKDRVARETDASRQAAALAARVEELAAAQQGARASSDVLRRDLERVLSILTAAPKAKDAVISELEEERIALARLAHDRQEALRLFADERREVEKSMGDDLLKLTGQLEEERSRHRAAEAGAAAIRGEIETWKARAAEREARAQQLSAERDELALALMAEADKVRRRLEELRAADEEAEKRATELRRLLGEETARRAAAESSALDARGHMSALAEQTARALQERDATIARYSDWEKERQRLLDIVRKKDEMISLLSATFQGALKKGA